MVIKNTRGFIRRVGVELLLTNLVFFNNHHLLKAEESTSNLNASTTSANETNNPSFSFSWTSSLNSPQKEPILSPPVNQRGFQTLLENRLESRAESQFVFNQLSDVYLSGPYLKGAYADRGKDIVKSAFKEAAGTWAKDNYGHVIDGILDHIAIIPERSRISSPFEGNAGIPGRYIESEPGRRWKFNVDPLRRISVIYRFDSTHINLNSGIDGTEILWETELSPSTRLVFGAKYGGMTLDLCKIALHQQFDQIKYNQDFSAYFGVSHDIRRVTEDGINNTLGEFNAGINFQGKTENSNQNWLAAFNYTYHF